VRAQDTKKRKQISALHKNKQKLRYRSRFCIQERQRAGPGRETAEIKGATEGGRGKKKENTSGTMASPTEKKTVVEEIKTITDRQEKEKKKKESKKGDYPFPCSESKKK